MSLNNIPGEVDRISLYIRIASAIRARINIGEWKRAERIPTIEQFAREYGVGRITVQKAFDLLVDDGLIEAARGRGTIVAREPRAAHFDEGLREAINQGNQGLTFARDETAEILSKSDVREIPAQFGIVNESAQRFCLIQKVHLHRKQPFSALDCLIDIETFKRFPRMAYKKEKLLKVVYDLGVKLTSNRQEITLVYADSHLAKLLKCQIAAALVQVRSWRYDASGRLIFAAVIRYRGDQFIYDIVDGDAPASQNRALIIPKARA